MMRVLALLLVLAGTAQAQTARVASGEHGDFTRLVIQLPDESAWTVGRTALGYGFAIKAVDQPAYDLSRVWDRIPRTRLQALRVDPGTGVLEMTLACPCHVFPFEYQPGMIVLDIRNGLPPPGSAFETAFTLDAAASGPSLVTVPRSTRVFDWLEIERGGSTVSRRDVALVAERGSVSLDPLRDELLAQISRGAADGVIDMRLPGKPATMPASEDDLPWVRIRLGELPGVEVSDPRAARVALQPDGNACLPDAQLSISEWGDARSAPDLLAQARAGLYGEFDAIDPKAVQTSVRLHLYLGFGAEALQYAALLPETDSGLRVLVSMARLIEGESDPETPFAPMLACDGAAALWAALVHDRLPSGAKVDAEAIARSFLALPPHLRQHLGERLAGLLQQRHPNEARIIRDAMERTPEVSTATVALLDARAELSAGRPDAARVHAEAALSKITPRADGFVVLVEAHFRSSTPLDPDVVDQLQAMRRETGRDSAFLRALVLALALSGQVADAFELADPGAVTADLWQVVQDRAADDTFLAHAVLPLSIAPPPVAPEVSLAIGARLQKLGFPEASLVWLGTIGPDSATDRRLLAAAAELGRGDARQALVHLTGLEGEEADLLRAKGLARLGDYVAARSALERAGKAEEATQLAIWQADWKGLDGEAANRWGSAAIFVEPPDLPEGGPITRGAALLEDSAAARSALSDLLAAVPAPSP